MITYNFDALPILDLSVVTYNSLSWLDKFFTSLVGQSYPTKNICIFIRDHESSDGTLPKLIKIKNEYEHYFNKIEITKGKNLGFGCGHNQNLILGNSAYFLVTNVDLEFAPDAILQAVTMAILDSDNVASWEFRQKPYEHPKYYHPATLETNWSSNACILFRRSAISAVGSYETKIFMYGEDVELSYRLRDHGYKLKYCPKAVCWHYTYKVENEIKPLQYFGNTLANMYIRLRYGSCRDIFNGFFLYAALFFLPARVSNQRLSLFKNLLKVISNSLYFLRSRKKSRQIFTFKKWDYEIRRLGAFYKQPEFQNDNYPLVSIIMRTHQGRLNYLKEAINSVINQTYPNIQLIVIEDGTEYMREYVTQLAKKNFIFLIEYHSIAKGGRCVAGNAGLSLAKGQYISFLDDDDLYFADHLEILVTELQAKPEIAGAYALAFEVQTKLSSQAVWQYQEYSHIVVHRQKFSRLLLWHHNYIPIQSMVFKKELFEKEGGFDESLEYLEDWNLWTRYSLQNNFMLVDKVTSIYRVPYSIKELRARHDKLHEYYVIAKEKQRHMLALINPAEILDDYFPLLFSISLKLMLIIKFKKLVASNGIIKAFNYSVRWVNFKCKFKKSLS